MNMQDFTTITNFKLCFDKSKQLSHTISLRHCKALCVHSSIKQKYTFIKNACSLLQMNEYRKRVISYNSPFGPTTEKSSIYIWSISIADPLTINEHLVIESYHLFSVLSAHKSIVSFHTKNKVCAPFFYSGHIKSCKKQELFTQSEKKNR